MRIVNDDEMTKKIILIAEMYYVHGMSQEEISKRMKMSRPWVSKLLKRAEEIGVVRIEVNSPLSGCVELEDKIKAQYNIENVFVIKSTNAGSMASVGHAAGNYLSSHIQNGDVVGISRGLSVSTAVDYVTPMQVDDVTVVPLVGGAGSKLECQSNVIANNLAVTLSAKCEFLHANAYCADEKEYEAIMSNPMTQRLINLGEHVDVAVIGLGGMENNRMIRDGYITEEDVEELQRMGAVGDVAFRFLDKGGDVLDVNVNNRIIASDLEKTCENAREVVAIGFGREKTETLKAMMRGGLVTTLFTDFDTAELLLSKKRRRKNG